MGTTFQKNLKKCKSLTGYRWVTNRRFIMKKAIPKKRYSGLKYTLRSQRSRSLQN